MKLRYTLPALSDLNSILDYVAAASPQGARRVQHRIQSIDDPVIRRSSTTPYFSLVFYEVGEGEIIVHAVSACRPKPARHARVEPVGGRV